MTTARTNLLAAALAAAALAAGCAAPGPRPPREKLWNCVGRNAYVPTSLWVENKAFRVVAKFMVYKDGSPGRVTVFFENGDGISQRDRERIADEITRGVFSCSWVPARDAKGKVVEEELVYPVAFTGR